MTEITEKEAAEFTRAQAIEALRHSPNAADRRMAEILGAGPDMTPADEQRLRGFRFRPQRMAGSVHLALREIGAEADWNRKAAEDDIAELGGARR